MTVTDQQRAEFEQWRREAQRLMSYDHPYRSRIVALLDALDAAEAQSEERRLDAAHWEHEYDLVNEALDAAETALRDMEIERNMLRTVVGGAMETVVKAWDEGYGAAVSDSADVVQAFERRNPYRAALAGPSPTDEGGES